MILDERETTEVTLDAAKETARETTTARRRPQVAARRGLWRHPRALSATLALALLVLVNVALQFDRRALDIASDDFWGLRRVQQCETLGRAPDVLYLGSSRTVYGIDPAAIDAANARALGRATLGCNAATVGSTLEQDYYTLKRVIEDGKAPRLVVETLWEWNLNTNAGRTADRAVDHFHQVLSLADLRDLPQLRDRFGAGYGDHATALDFAAGKLIPLYGDRMAILRALCRGSRAGPCAETTSQLDPGMQQLYPTATRQGWIAAPGSSIAALTPTRRAAQLKSWTYLHPELQHFRIGGGQPAYLDRLIALARAHHIQVALVLTPLDPLYFQYFDDPYAWPRIVAYWRAFAAARATPLYDQSQSPAYTDADFADPQHLSPAGAEKFSAWLASQVVGPALAERASA